MCKNTESYQEENQIDLYIYYLYKKYCTFLKLKLKIFTSILVRHAYT